jgi:energy-coupling factor transporter transmembrane protein EcfT
MHTLPFLVPSLHLALTMAYVIVAAELVVIAYIRYRFMKSPLGSTVVQVLLGGALVFFTGLWMGSWGGGE